MGRTNSQIILRGTGTKVGFGKTATYGTTATPPPRILVNHQTASNPHELARLLNNLGQQVADATQGSRSTPFNNGVLVSNYIPPGATDIIQHNLGRRIIGYIVTKSLGRNWQAYLDTHQFNVHGQSGSGTIDATKAVRFNGLPFVGDGGVLGAYDIWFF